MQQRMPLKFNFTTHKTNTDGYDGNGDGDGH